MLLRSLNIVICLFLLIWAFRWWKRNNGAELYATPVAIYALHSMIFYISVLLNYSQTIALSSVFLNSWSSGLRLHGLVTIFLLTISIQRLRRRLI